MIAKIAEVEEAFRLLDAEIALFQSWSTLHCNQGCGKCCYKADLEATTLEFLPFAHFLYLQGTAFDWLEKLRSRTSPLCVILDPAQTGAGLCSEYTHRGLICRLFGYSARTTKYGKKELVTCQVIKTEQAESYQAAKGRVEAGDAVPVMNQFYMRLHSIDPELTREFFPINEAIKRAIEVILHYYAYRE
jgi:uncharacterized protein